MYFGARPRIPSYFALEAQAGDRTVGRVLRFDSFSKIISAGIRIGFVTGPTPLLAALDKHVSGPPSFHVDRAVHSSPTTDGHCELAGVLLRSGSRRDSPALLGPRGIPRAHMPRRRFLS